MQIRVPPFIIYRLFHCFTIANVLIVIKQDIDADPNTDAQHLRFEGNVR